MNRHSRWLPSHFEARIGLALSLGELGQFLAAEDSYKKALALRPDFGAIYYSLGYLYQQQGLYAEAAAQYEEAVRLMPTFLQARPIWGGSITCSTARRSYCRVSAHARRSPRRRAGVRALGRELHGLEPIRRSAGGLSASRGSRRRDGGRVLRPRRYQRTGRQARSGAELLSPSPAQNAAHADSYHRLGAVTAKLGQEQQAATYYLEAIKRDPGHAGAHYSLAQLYLKQGRSDEGQELMQVFAKLKEYEGRLASLKRAVEPVAAHSRGCLQLGGCST